MIKVATPKLRDGDKVHVMGAVVKIEGKPEIIERGRETVFSWRNMSIISGSLRGLPEVTLWTIQGNGMAFWVVTR